jgi:hypothetical protein
MKLFLFLFLPLFSLAQSKQTDILPMVNGMAAYSDTISIAGATKNDLYNRAKRWVSKQYNSPKDAVQVDDKEAGEILIKGVFSVDYYTRSPIIYHTLSISVKDGRYKYYLTDLNYSDNQNKNFAIENFPKSWSGQKKLFSGLNQQVETLINSLVKAMNESGNDW